MTTTTHWHDGNLTPGDYLLETDAATNYVPYTGATSDVDLGTHYIKTGGGISAYDGVWNGVDVYFRMVDTLTGDTPGFGPTTYIPMGKIGDTFFDGDYSLGAAQIRLWDSSISNYGRINIYSGEINFQNQDGTKCAAIFGNLRTETLSADRKIITSQYNNFDAAINFLDWRYVPKNLSEGDVFSGEQITGEGPSLCIKGENSIRKFLLEGMDVSGKSIKVADETVLGYEKLTNGTFTGNATSWTLGTGWAYSADTVVKNADGTGTLSQAVGSMVTQFVVGETYLLTYTITGITTPDENKYITASAGGNIFYWIANNGTFSHTFVAKSNTALTFTPTNTLRCTIDSISIKRIIGGDIIALGDANISGRVTQAGTYAEIYVADGSTAQAIATGTTYTKLTAFTTNGSSSNCTADATNDKITITKAGKYLVNVQISGNDGVAGATFKAALFYDGVEQSNIHSTTKYNAGSEIDSMSMSGILASAANKDIDVRLAHDAGGAVNFTTQYANLSITYIGE